jgi:type I restriction enzyme S subunit
MKSDRIKIPLGDVLVLQRGFDLPSTARTIGNYPVVASTGVAGMHNESRVKGPGVVIGRSGTIGGGQYIDGDFWPLNTTLWVKDAKGNDIRYIYYLLKSIDFSTFNNGTGVPTLNRNHLNLIQVVKFTKDEQKSIAKILGDLDQKIELNKKINKTLEEMGQALFKNYFLENSNAQKWPVRELGDFLTVERGLSYKGEYLKDGGLPMINLGSINLKGEYSPKGLKFYTGDYKERNIVKPEDLVFANTDITQDREVLGSVISIPNIGEEILYSHHISALKNIQLLPKTFIYFLLKQQAFRERARGFATGTTILGLPAEAVTKLEFNLPGIQTMNDFNKLAEPILKEKELVRAEIENLEAIRDALSPRLLSGRISL